MSIIVLDTDVASASLRNRLPDRLRARLAGHTMCITFVTIGELAKWRGWCPTTTSPRPSGAGGHWIVPGVYLLISLYIFQKAGALNRVL